MTTITDYGGGQSTGLDQTAAGRIVTGFTRDDLAMTAEDRAVLRRLAERVAAIAATPANGRDPPPVDQDSTAWKRPGRPVFCDPENGWNEIITEAQMQCRGKLARRWEMDLRKEIFWGEVMGDDKPVEPCFNVPYTASAGRLGTSGGLPQERRRRLVCLGRRHQGLRRRPEADALAAVRDRLGNHQRLRGRSPRTCLGDLLPVRLKGVWWWSLGLTWPAATFRGLQNMLCDFIEHPDELKELLSILSRGYLDKLDYLEANGLLSLNNDGTYVGSGGFGFSDELPQPDFAGHVRTGDMWGFTESQETVHVSPAMYEEFIFPYEKPIMERFGLTCYGCCEPLHGRWHVVKQHPHLRRVSCSPWVDVEKMAANLGDKYIFSMKPNPAALAVPEVDAEAIRTRLREILEKTRGCVVELIMKDNHTLAQRPENAVTWCRIAKEEAERLTP